MPCKLRICIGFADGLEDCFGLLMEATSGPTESNHHHRAFGGDCDAIVVPGTAEDGVEAAGSRPVAAPADASTGAILVRTP